MTTLERFAFAVIAIATTCCAAPGPKLPARPAFVDPILPKGLVKLEPGQAEALVVAAGDTVFVHAAGADTLALWDGRKLAGTVGITYHDGDPQPQPDDMPVLCAHFGEVCVVFTAQLDGAIVAGVVYKPSARRSTRS